MVVEVRSDATRIRALGRGSSEAGHPKFWASGRDVRGGPAPENGRVEGRSEARHPKEDPHVMPSRVPFPPRSQHVLRLCVVYTTAFLLEHVFLSRYCKSWLASALLHKRILFRACVCARGWC
jgi:hypothetical protein